MRCKNILTPVDDNRPVITVEDDIQILENIDLDLEGAVLIEGFPSVGMVSTIVSNYLIKMLGLGYSGSISSRHFYPTAVISDSVPMPPVRIYTGDAPCKNTGICERIVLLTSEFPPALELMKPLVDNIIRWSDDKGIELIISVEGILSDRTSQEGSADVDDGSTPIFAIASSQHARDLIAKKPGLTPLTNGVITGISGVLLHEAERLQKNVVCLLSDAHPNFPDARAASRLIVALDLFLPKLKLDPKPLIEEADKLEEQLKKVLEQARPALPAQPGPPGDSSVMFG